MNQIALSTFMCVAPGAVERAQRLEYAVALLHRNISERDVTKRIERHYDCSWHTAWRTVNMARDIA